MKMKSLTVTVIDNGYMVSGQGEPCGLPYQECQMCFETRDALVSFIDSNMTTPNDVIASREKRMEEMAELKQGPVNIRRAPSANLTSAAVGNMNDLSR